MIDKVYEFISAICPEVKYGVYENEAAETLIGVTETRKKTTGFLSESGYEYLITVNVAVYASSYINGLNEAIKLQGALNGAGYVIYEEIESSYDRQIGKYIIKFAVCEK